MTAQADWQSSWTRSSFHFTCCHHWRPFLSEISCTNRRSPKYWFKIKEKASNTAAAPSLFRKMQLGCWGTLANRRCFCTGAVGAAHVLWALLLPLPQVGSLHSCPPQQQLDLQLEQIRAARSFLWVGWGPSQHSEVPIRSSACSAGRGRCDPLADCLEQSLCL